MLRNISVGEYKLSELNLVPNPVALGIQAGLFLTSALVVKRLFVGPYLKLRHARLELTTGQADKSKEIKDRVIEVRQTIEAKRIQANQKILAETDALLASAKSENEKVVSSFQEENNKRFQEFRNEVLHRVQEERQKLDKDIRQLSSDVLKKLLV